LLPNDIGQAIWLLFHVIVVLVLLLMLIDYFADCACAYSLGTVPQIKIMRKPLLAVAGLWFGIYLWQKYIEEKIV
jgi:hypothetical protein